MDNFNMNFRTDMADERVDEYKKVHNLSEIDGIIVNSEVQGKAKITTVEVINENGKNAVNKPIGKYITMEIDDMEYLEQEEKDNLIQTLANQIKLLVGGENKPIMVVGLGNEYVTPDALGPKVISNVNVTRHVIKYAKEIVKPGTREISAISPGVMGMTGIETEEIIDAVTHVANPGMLIVIDSLASMSVSRIGKTIQLGNTGIEPGAGVDNKRHALNEENLGIPVIVIGVPTVVESTVIVNDCLVALIEKLQSEAKSNSYLNELKNKNNYDMIKQVLTIKNYNMIVTPKEIDNIIDKISKIISDGINVAI